MNTDVKILGKTYSVRSEFDPAFTTETADVVNGKMRELMGKAGTLPTEKIAVLTAMNLAGELIKLRKRHDGIVNVLRHKAQKLLKLVNAAL